MRGTTRKGDGIHSLRTLREAMSCQTNSLPIIVKEWWETDRNDEKDALGQIRLGINFLILYLNGALFKGI